MGVCLRSPLSLLLLSFSHGPVRSHHNLQCKIFQAFHACFGLEARMASIPNQETYDPNEAIKRTVKVSMKDGRAINLGQVNKLFVDQPIEITYRISKNVVGVVYKNEADCAMALELNGTEIIPKSSAKLPSQIIKVELMKDLQADDENEDSL